MQGEVDLVGVLHGLVHRFRLPPRSVHVAAEIGHVERRVQRLVAHVTRLLGHLTAGLDAELRRPGLAARVGRFYFQIERRVLETGDTPLRIIKSNQKKKSQTVHRRCDEENEANFKLHDIFNLYTYEYIVLSTQIIGVRSLSDFPATLVSYLMVSTSRP